MIPFGNVPINPPAPDLPGNLNTIDDPHHRIHQNVTDPKHGTNIQVNLSTAELNQDVPLTVLTGNIGFQQPAASYPLLPPFARLRMPEMEKRVKSRRPEEIYDELVNALPAELKARMQENLRLPKEERDPSVMAFVDSLLIAALFLTTIDTFGKKEIAESDLEKEGIMFVQRWRDSLREEGDLFMTRAKEYVGRFDAGSPERETLLHVIQEMDGALTSLPQEEVA